MNMNFIAFSSRAKLLDRPHLDAAAAGHRHLRGRLDGLLRIPGLDQQQAGQLAVAHPDRGCSLDWLRVGRRRSGRPSGGVIVGQAFLDAGVRLLLGHRVHVVLDNIYQADGLQDPPAAGEWLRTPACRSEGAEIDSRDGYARKSADSAGDVSGCGSTQYRLQSYVARRARSRAAMRR